MSRHNKHNLEDATIIAPGKNPSCGDEIELALKVEDSRIVDGAYTGIGCAISQASVSIMIDLVRGKTVSEALALSQLFMKMIRSEPMTSEEKKKLDETLALANVANMPARVKCATMPWHTLEEALKTLEKTTGDKS